MKETESRRLGDMIHKDLKRIAGGSETRSDKRRAIEDLLEARRYREMHESIEDLM